jgi:hypothetical protein
MMQAVLWKQAAAVSSPRRFAAMRWQMIASAPCWW